MLSAVEPLRKVQALLPEKIASHICLSTSDGEYLSGHEVFLRRVTSACNNFTESTERACREKIFLGYIDSWTHSVVQSNLPQTTSYRDQHWEQWLRARNRTQGIERMPVMNKLPTLLREDRESAFGDDLDNVFDVTNLRHSLGQRKRDAEIQLKKIMKLREMFRKIHEQLSMNLNPA